FPQNWRLTARPSAANGPRQSSVLPPPLRHTFALGANLKLDFSGWPSRVISSRLTNAERPLSFERVIGCTFGCQAGRACLARFGDICRAIRLGFLLLPCRQEAIGCAAAIRG